ncbi:MAG: hypothetical protein ACR2M8_05585 [Pyrinomonadaceae bacterium]|nr:hypothetical protein [Acidobacteriota bacterium]
MPRIHLFLSLLSRLNVVITGFNTNIEFEGVTYHVQTEDKGLSKPIILSLVYDRGTILASKRLPYDDLLTKEFDEKLLEQRLQKQHKLICAAIRGGRIEDLKQMTVRDSGTARLPSLKKQDTAAFPARPDKGVARKKNLDFFETKTLETGLPIPKPLFEKIFEPPKTTKKPIKATVNRDEEVMLPDEAVEVLGETTIPDRTVNNNLSIEILGDMRFKGGERSTIWFMVCRGSHRKVVAGAQVMVKILGSSFRPVIFHASTDRNGLANVNLQLPNFKSGRAAFLVRAISDGEEVELRRSMVNG